MEEGLFHNPTFVKHVTEFAVAAIGHRGKHKEVDGRDPETGAKIKVCPSYNTIPCSAHNAISSGAAKVAVSNGMPQSYIVMPDGTTFKKIPARSPANVIKALNDAQMKIGKRPITRSMIRKMAKGLFKGDALIRKGKFKAALKAYTKVLKGKKTPAFIKEMAEKRIAALKEAILKAIESAKALPAKKAKRALKKIIRELKDRPELKKKAEEAMNGLG